MRLRLLGFIIPTLLLALVIGLPTTQAQTTDFGERDPFWVTDNRFDMPATLCHIPPGNPANAHSIEVPQSAVPAHLAHGDLLGACPYECPAYPAAVAATGQTGCWNQPGNPINCPGTGQDGEHQAGVSVDPRFTDNSDGTVTDNLSGLIWLRDANCFGRRNWTNALADANTLAGGSCGLTDGSVAGNWRLPNLKELLSLIDYGRYAPVLPRNYPFSGVQLDYYWTSTSIAYDPFPSRAWRVYLDDGWINSSYKTYSNFVWPVRGGL